MYDFENLPRQRRRMGQSRQSDEKRGKTILVSWHNGFRTKKNRNADGNADRDANEYSHGHCNAYSDADSHSDPAIGFRAVSLRFGNGGACRNS